MIYFISNESGLIKIGTTTNLDVRMKAIAYAEGMAVTLLATCEGGLAAERSIHSRFSDLRRRGEWFEDCAQLRDFIGDLAGFVPPPEKPQERITIHLGADMIEQIRMLAIKDMRTLPAEAAVLLFEAIKARGSNGLGR